MSTPPNALDGEPGTRAAVRASAPAKVNLYLGVGGLRADGFHPLATVYQAVGLRDEVTVTDSDDLTVDVVGRRGGSAVGVPTDRSNVAARAALLLAEHHGLERGVRITIAKRIPVAGGMAGGSADAAATLVGCDLLWGLGTPREELLELAAALGSDVPFALVGGTAVGSGRGELLTTLAPCGPFWWVVLEAADGLSTPEVYREFDALHAGSPLPAPEIPDRLVQALRDHDVAGLGAALDNDLEAAALRLRPELGALMDLGRSESVHGALLSGSGPSCLFLCGSRAHAVRVAGALSGRGLGRVSVAPGPAVGATVVAREGVR